MGMEGQYTDECETKMERQDDGRGVLQYIVLFSVALQTRVSRDGNDSLLSSLQMRFE